MAAAHKEKERTKARRAAAGSEAVRDQIRKMVVGGPLAAEDKNRVDAVSDSEDDQEELAEALKSESSRWQEPDNALPASKTLELMQAICGALGSNMLFKGISQELLTE
eukprot:gene866-1188_t